MPKMRLGLLPAPTKKALPVVPNNYGMEAHVEQEIERTIQVANARFNTALATNGVPVMIWRRQNAGYVCTCQNHDTRLEDDADSAIPIAPQTPEPPANNSVIRVQGSRALNSQQNNTGDRVLGVDLGGNDDDPHAKPGFENRPNDDVLNEDGARFLDQAAYRSFLDSGQNTTTCGICLGSGWTAGYGLYGGQRLVLDSHGLTDNDGFDIEQEDDAPLTYKGPEGSVLTWTLDLPAFFKTARIMARNNIKPADVDLRVNGTPLPLQGLLAFKGQTVSITATALVDDTELTHVDIILQFSEWPRTQIDKLTQDLSYNAPESTQTLDFPFSPSIQTLGREDVFVDFLYNKVWRVNSVTPDQTAKGQTISWSVSATSRTTFDILSLLSAVQYPAYQLSYRNLDI